MPVRTARVLRRPGVTGARMLEVGDGVLVAQVQGPYADETYELPLPVVDVLEKLGVLRRSWCSARSTGDR